VFVVVATFLAIQCSVDVVAGFLLSASKDSPVRCVGEAESARLENARTDWLCKTDQAQASFLTLI